MPIKVAGRKHAITLLIRISLSASVLGMTGGLMGLLWHDFTFPVLAKTLMTASFGVSALSICAVIWLVE